MEDKNAKEKKFVSVVVYLHNDAAYVENFIQMISAAVMDHFADGELIFVNDASTDDSVERIRRYFKENSEQVRMVSILELSHFQGQESAMNAGRDLAIGDFVYEFDDMLVDYDPALTIEVYEKALTGYDIVSAGCKNATKLTSRFFYNLYNRLNRSGTALATETFRIISRRAINQVKSLDQYIPYRKAVYMNCGLKSTLAEYVAKDTSARKQIVRSRHERSSLAVDSLIYFTNAMEKLAIVMCLLFAGIAIALGIDIIYETAAFTQPVEGWRSTMGFLAAGFLGAFLILAIIVRYLSVLVNITFRRNRYMVSGIEKIIER